MSIAERIVRLRGRRTQGEVGQAIWPDIDINAAQQRISRLEKLRDEDFKVKDLRLLADYYGVELSEVVGIKGVIESIPANMIEKLRMIYEDPDSAGAKIMDVGFKLAEGQEMLYKIMEKLDRIEGIITKNTKRIKDIEESLKTGTGDRKSEVGGM